MVVERSSEKLQVQRDHRSTKEWALWKAHSSETTWTDAVSYTVRLWRVRRRDARVSDQGQSPGDIQSPRWHWFDSVDADTDDKRQHSDPQKRSRDADNDEKRDRVVDEYWKRLKYEDTDQ